MSDVNIHVWPYVGTKRDRYSAWTGTTGAVRDVQEPKGIKECNNC